MAGVGLQQLTDWVAPLELGVGKPGGCEAAVHAAHQFVDTMPSNYAVAKLVFHNVM